MNLADARALFPPDTVTVHEDRPDRRDRALDALAHWALRLTPVVAAEPPDGLVLDVTGCERLYGHERRMLAIIDASVRRLGFHTRAALASTRGGAWALARFAPTNHAITDPHDPVTALRPLPVQALRLDDECVRRLHDVGIERIEDLIDLPRRAIPARFGDDVLLRLDQARGDAFETIESVREPEPLEASRRFAGPTTRIEAIEQCAYELIGTIVETLRTQERGVTLLQLQLVRADAPPVDLEFSFSYPSRDLRHLWSIVRPRLERASLGYGVDAMHCRAARSRRIAHAQYEQWGGNGRATRRETDRHFGTLIDALTDRLGDQRVHFVDAQASHIPERAFRRRSTRTGTEPGRATPVATPDRPSWLETNPVPIRLMIMNPDGPIMRMRIGSLEHDIVTTLGPERIGPPWWDCPSDASARDFFKLQDEHGRWFWVCRELRTNRWLLIGEWT